MHRRALSRFPLTLQVAFLVLAFSVFSWGLQARLSQYKTNGCPSESVKMSTDKRSSLNSLPTSAEEEPKPDFERFAYPLIFFAMYQSAVTSPNATVQVELSLVTPSRYDAQGPGLMLRPPPANS